MSKISQYAQNTTPALTDYLIGVLASGPTTKRFVLSDLVTLFLNNIPAAEGTFGFVSSGLVWTADAAGSTRVASMTLGRVKVNSTFLAIAAVTSRTFTASKDTYIDILDNADGTGTIVYTEVTNNAASPALASNSLRIGIIVTGATTIAAAASINQGQEDRILPIASSIPYQTTDSLGNLICSRDPTRSLLGLRRQVGNQGTSSTSVVQATALSMPIIVPTGGRRIAFDAKFSNITSDSGALNPYLSIWQGTVGSGTQLDETTLTISASAFAGPLKSRAVTTLAAGSYTINAGIKVSASSATYLAATTTPALLEARLS
jgi:hypothetical protein